MGLRGYEGDPGAFPEGQQHEIQADDDRSACQGKPNDVEHG